jgi:hypothetical protein
VLQTATSPAKVSPRHPEAPRAQCRSPMPRYRREFAKKPPPVSRSAVPIRRRRCRSGPADSLCTSAGPSRSVSAIQRTRPPLQHLPPRAPPALPPDVVVFLNPSRLRPPQPSVSLASYPWSFCTRSCRHWLIIVPRTPLAGVAHCSGDRSAVPASQPDRTSPIQIGPSGPRCSDRTVRTRMRPNHSI